MVADINKARGAGAPPHELDVRKFAEARASELESLHSVIANRLNNDFRSQRNKRKRTTGHDDRVAKRRCRMRRRVGIGDVGKSKSLWKDEKKVSRRVRRSIDLKSNPQHGFVTSGDGTKRLRTHVWHAKRFTMRKLWGFHLPLGLHGRGRGSRALLKKLRNGVLVHDASYNDIVQLEGPQNTLLSVLSSVLSHIPSENSEETSRVLSGDIFGTSMLNHAGQQGIQPIALVIYMWRPLPVIIANTEPCTHDCTAIRQLWIWIHAAAFKEAFEALCSACKRQMDLAGNLAKCTSLEGLLAKFEMVGPKAFQLLQKTLLRFSRRSENSWHMKKSSVAEVHNHGEQEKTAIFKENSGISPGSIIPLIVKDPRASSITDCTNIPEGLEQNNGLHFSLHDGCETAELSHSLFIKQEMQRQVGCRDLWDASQGVFLPMIENEVCMHKNRQRKEIIRLVHKCCDTQSASAEGEYSNWCPIFLVKNNSNWFSIFLPLSWVKVFWINLVSNGAHAIGLREKNWIAGEIGLPCFPVDFPDCKAYFDFMSIEAFDSDQKAMLRPPSKRPLKVPIPPPWNSVQDSFEKESSATMCSHNQVKEIGSDFIENETTDNMIKTSECQKSETTLFDCLGVPFEGCVARTSIALIEFMNAVKSSHLLLFPRIPGQTNSISKFMNDKEFREKLPIASELKYEKPRCFLRVLLHAYKEGVFEQGALVCAPHVADIVLWTRSDGESQQLQIPESLLKSYFMQLPSGKWELQAPEDHDGRESLRCPIGFVTTGFVQGSPRAMAGALCEPSFLSRIRMEQWKALPVRKRRHEIFVLVRNMRSTAYKLALATIVLEQQEHDVDFM